VGTLHRVHVFFVGNKNLEKFCKRERNALYAASRKIGLFNGKEVSKILFNIRRGIALLEGSKFSPASPSDKNCIQVKMSVEQRLNKTGRGKRKYWEEHLLKSIYIKC
jgi:hypothetical protein